MPGGMGKLSCLERLSNFVVGKQWSDELEDLKALNNLQGSLEVWIRWPVNGMNVVQKNDSREGLYLRSKEHLNAIHLTFFSYIGRIDDVFQGTIISLIEDLQPHSNLKELKVWGYEGVRMPGWINLLQDLVHLYLQECANLEYLSCLGNLSRLKYLEFSHLDEIEYIEGGGGGEEEDSHLPGFGSPVETLSFFPSLKELVLWQMTKLKGWRKEVRGRSKPPLQLPSLSKLQIFDCLELTCTIICPSLEDLDLTKFNKEMRIIMNSRKVGESSMSFSSHSSNPEDSTSSSNCSYILVPKLKDVKIDDVTWLDSVPVESLQCLEVLHITDNDELVS